MADHNDTLYRRAACGGVPAELFFPEQSPPDPRHVAQAKAICASCPVRDACLAVGMAEEHGIWGGLDPNERRLLRRRQREGAA